MATKDVMPTTPPPSGPPRRPRLPALRALLLLGVAALGASPVACSTDSGGVGLGIATIGISAIFAGTSPGWRVADPAQLSPTVAVTGLSTTITAEPPIVLQAGESIDRVAIPGGRIPTLVEVVGDASGTDASTALSASLIYASWEAQGPKELVLATGSALVGVSASASIAIALDFTTFTRGGAVLAGLSSQPGDSFRVRLANSGAGTLTLDTSRSLVRYSSRSVRETRFRFVSQGSSGARVEEEATFQVVSNGSAPARVAAAQAVVTTLPGFTAPYAVVVTDANGVRVPGVSVAFGAIGSIEGSGQASTDSAGVARASFTYANLGAFVITAQAAGVTSAASIQVNVIAGGAVGGGNARPYDGLASVRIVDAGIPVSLTSKVELDLRALLDPTVYAGTVTNTSFPTLVEYVFERDAASESEWRVDLIARTISQASTATCGLVIRVIDPFSGLVVAQSPFVTVRSDLRQFAGSLVSILPVRARSDGPGSGAFRKDAFLVSLIATGSNDPTAPGIELIVDESLPSLFSAPGPVVFATSPTSVTFLASQPDPRR